MFDKIADFIMKHSKAIIVIWLIVILASVYPLAHLSDVMEYDLSKMADDNFESVKGMKIIEENFPKSEDVPDSSKMQLLIITYEDREAAENFFNYYLWVFINEYRGQASIKDPIDLTENLGCKEGALIIGFPYDSNEDTNTIANDTPALRQYIEECKSKFTYDGNEISFNTYLTGNPAINYDTMANALDDVSKVDPFTILFILLLIGLFFRSFVTSAVPPATIGVAFTATAIALFFIGHITGVFFITQMMILVTMMGAGCDYCIFIISRYKEELHNGKNHHDALREAIIWAGESIATSGCTVIIGFGALSLCSYRMVSMMGICLAIGILFALIAALTLIPSIINILGEKIFWPSKKETFDEGGKVMNGWYGWFSRLGKKYFNWSANFSLKHAWAIVIVAVLITVPAAYLTFSNQPSYDMLSSMQSGESGEGMDKLAEYADQGFLMPSSMILEFNDSFAEVKYDQEAYHLGMLTWNPSFINETGDGNKNRLDYLVNNEILAKDDNIAWANSKLFPQLFPNGPEVVFSMDVPVPTSDVQKLSNKEINAIVEKIKQTDPEIEQFIDELKSIKKWDNKTFLQEGEPYLDYFVNVNMLSILGGSFSNDSQGGHVTFLKMTFQTIDSPMSFKSMDSLNFILNTFNSFVDQNKVFVYEKYITGTPLMMGEVSHIFSSEFKIVEVAVVVLILILLLIVMKSYLIPIRSVLTILMSITWTLSLTSFIFVTCLGGELIWMTPMILLVICLGLGMDYDILLTTRIKENVLKGMSNDEAIHSAVTSTGSIITICGLIMGGAFGTLMISSMEMMSEFGFALCFAILVDALIVRTYIVPAVMHLLGDWNWKGPKFLKRKSEKQIQ